MAAQGHQTDGSTVPLQGGGGSARVSDGPGRVFFSQTVLVDAHGPHGDKQIRAIIDGGSDCSFIRASVARELGLQTVGKGRFAYIGFQEHTEKACTYDQVAGVLSSKHTGKEVVLKFWCSERLCGPLGERQIPVDVTLPSGVQLADDYKEGPIDMLIGLDQMYLVVLWDHVELSPSLRLIETIFGHVLHGLAVGPGEQPNRHGLQVPCCGTDVES